MSNPFEASQADVHDPAPRVRLGEVLTDGTVRAVRHLPHFFAAALVLMAGYLVSLLALCVGLLFTLPHLLYGLYRFTLSVADGRPTMSKLWSGQRDPVGIFLSGWGVFLLLAVVMSPSVMASVAGQLAAEREMIPAWAGTVAPALMGALWAGMVAPLLYAPYVWADRDASPVEAFGLALDAMKASWGSLAVIAVLTQVVLLPNAFFSIYLEQQQAVLLTATPDEAMGLLTEMFGAIAVLYSLLFVGGTVSSMWTAVAYRQVFPAAQAPNVDELAAGEPPV